MEGARITYEEEKAMYSDLQARQRELAEQERAQANAAVAAALAGYRWWGWTNIVNSVRLWVQAWRLRA